jgi:hypothetical protein
MQWRFKAESLFGAVSILFGKKVGLWLEKLSRHLEMPFQQARIMLPAPLFSADHDNGPTGPPLPTFR